MSVGVNPANERKYAAVAKVLPCTVRLQPFAPKFVRPSLSVSQFI